MATALTLVDPDKVPGIGGHKMKYCTTKHKNGRWDRLSAIMNKDNCKKNHKNASKRNGVGK